MSDHALLPAVEQKTGPDPSYSVIWLHGLGADGNDFVPIVPALDLPSAPAVRFIFPHAPAMPVTVNGGFVMPAWYDIRHMEIDREVDLDGLLASVAAIERFVAREIERGIAAEKIIIAGFSQGGAVAYHLALSRARPCGGLLAMSTYLASRELLVSHGTAGGLVIEIHHGLFDPIVPERLGREARDFLEEHGYGPRYRTYPMEHTVSPEQVADIGAWFRSRIET